MDDLAPKNEEELRILGIMIVLASILAVMTIMNIIRLVKTILVKPKKPASNLELATEFSVCPGRHAWGTIALDMPQIKKDVYSVCIECGFVAGTGYKLNETALEIFHLHLAQTKN